MIILKADKLSERQKSIRDELVAAGCTPGLQDLTTTKLEERMSKTSSQQEYMKVYMVIATLIVTVSFAAGFTVLGGYDNAKENKEMAVLAKKAAFIRFVVSDSLTMILSNVVLLLQISFGERYSFINKKSRSPPPSSLLYPKQIVYDSKKFITFAMIFLVIAFTTGLYAILPQRAIKIYLAVVGSLFSFAVFVYKLVSVD